LHGVDWQLFADVSGEHICFILKGQAVREELLLTQESSSARLIL